MAGGGGGDGEPEFQVAPMVDVLLTILIFFMTITSAQVLKVDKSIHLPVAADASKKDDSRAEIIVNVRWHPETRRADFTLDDKVYAKSTDLTQPLRERKEAGQRKITANQNPNIRLVIRGDRNVPAGYVAQAMNAGGEAGIADISFSCVNKE
jgi:biopolymer transport protein ExbD